MTRPIQLVILDGFGLAPEGPGNAVALANTPVFDRIWRERPRTTLAASGLTHYSIRSFNNHWGVPLTLARLPKSAD